MYYSAYCPQLIFIMVTGERNTETASLPLDEKLVVWYHRVDNYSESGEQVDKEAIEDLLTQGYQLFFEILEPLKETDWIQAEHPDIHHQVWLDERDYSEKSSEFRGLFGWLNNSWGVEIYNYRKERLGDDLDASMRLRCGQQGTHGEKLIRVLYSPPTEVGFRYPHGQMYIEDTTASWLRSGEEGKLKTEQEKNLYNFSGLSLCKLAVALAEDFAKGHAKKQEAQAS